VLLLLLSSVPAQAAVVGREAPGCAEAVLSDVTGAVGIDAGTCLVVDLGTLEPGTVFEVDVLVIDDAIDLLVFDAAARSPYDLGQGYRAGMTLPASTESLLGELGFHWRVPASIQPKAWSMVLDNLAHDGDQGMGDQGGARSTVSLLVNPIDEGALTVVHDLYGVEANASSWLTPQGGLSLDAGTSLLLEAWPVDGAGDLLLLNDDERAAWEGGATMSPPAGRSMLDVDGDATLSWVLPRLARRHADAPALRRHEPDRGRCGERGRAGHRPPHARPTVGTCGHRQRQRVHDAWCWPHARCWRHSRPPDAPRSVVVGPRRGCGR
jgi:hypothetical protein